MCVFERERGREGGRGGGREGGSLEKEGETKTNDTKPVFNGVEKGTFP